MEGKAIMNWDKFQPLGEKLYPFNLPPNGYTALSQPTVIDYPRPGCLESAENRVRLAIKNMLPHDTIEVEGVEVRRTTFTSAGLVYVVAKGLQTTSFESAVTRVLALAGAEAVGGEEAR